MRWRCVHYVRQQPLVLVVAVLVVVVVRQWSQLRAGHLLSLAAARERRSLAQTVTSVRHGSVMQCHDIPCSLQHSVQCCSAA